MDMDEKTQALHEDEWYLLILWVYKVNHLTHHIREVH